MKLLERLSTVLVIVAASGVIFQLVSTRLSPTDVRGDADRQRVASKSVVGKKLQLSSDFKAGDKVTLLIAVSTGCHYCAESAPFYRKLVDVRAGSSGALRVVAVLPQDEKSASAYLSEKGIAVDRLFSRPLATIMVRGTPTLMLLDSNGTVRNVWLGRLSRDREHEVLAAIRALCARCAVS